MKFLFLGTGTSHGVPVIGCDCHVCKSTDKHDKRYRCSAYITTNTNKKILIDIGPDFRSQALENNIKSIDILLLTHSHADHLHGIDDLRIFSCDMHSKPKTAMNIQKYNAPPIPVYTNKTAINDVKTRFGYFFSHCTEGGGHAKVELFEAKETFNAADLQITPIPMMHGHLETVGWILSEKQTDGTKKSIAYLTDCDFISEESIQKVKDSSGILEHLIIDGLRIEEHSTHFNFLQALSVAEKIEAKHVWLTHLTHATSHQDVINYINTNISQFPGLKKAESVLPAYDKLELFC